MEDAYEEARTRYWQRQDEIAQQHASEFIGESADGASALASKYGLKLRLIEVAPDGTTFWTQEYELGRVTAILQGGVVTDSSPG